ncbi:MAG: 50S ribosomal protein L18 [Patescibacteria group bacterium]
MLTKDRLRRKKGIRAKISGTADVPRLAVFKSDRYIYAQAINDAKGVTLVSASDKDMKTGTKIAKAAAVGEKLAELAKAKKIKRIVFDRGGFLYQGRIKALADGARKAGLEF